MQAYIRHLVLVLLLLYPVSGFAADNGIMGALLGAGVGAAIGHSADRSGGAGKGAAIGAIGGYFIGQQINKNKPQKAATTPPKPALNAQCQHALQKADDAALLRNTTKKVFLLQNANRICPNSARIHNDLGVAYYQRGKLYDQRRARLELKYALQIDPNYSIAQRNLRAM